MRIVTLAICIAAIAGCSAELAERPSAHDPGNSAAAETPYHAPPSWAPDPLLGAAAPPRDGGT